MLKMISALLIGMGIQIPSASAAESAKIFHSINGQVNARLVVVPFSKGKYLLQFSKFEHEIDNKTFLYNKILIGQGDSRGAQFKMTGGHEVHFTSFGKSILVKGSTRDYSEVHLSGKKPIKMLYVKNAEPSIAQKVKAQYLETQGIFESKVDTKRHLQKSVNYFKKKCHPNLGIEVDWSSFEFVKQKTAAGMAHSYIKSLADVCKIDKDYHAAALNIKKILIKPSKTGKDKLKITGHIITLLISTQVPNVQRTSFKKMKDLL